MIIQLCKEQKKEEIVVKNKTDEISNKISYKKYYRLMGILGTAGGSMWIFYWVMDKFLPDIKKGHTLTNVINLIVSLVTLALIAICITKMISTVGKRDTNYSADNSKGQSDFYNVPVHDCLPVYFSYDFVFRYFRKI